MVQASHGKSVEYNRFDLDPGTWLDRVITR